MINYWSLIIEIRFFFQRKYSNDLKSTGKKTDIPLNLGSFLAIIVLIKIWKL